MEKIKMITPLVEMDGDEMTRIIWAMIKDELLKNTQFGSCIFANKPGDGSAREQAASCQKVLGGFANICYEYATKRYRSNCINWGILPFTIDEGVEFSYEEGDMVFVPGIRKAVEDGTEMIVAGKKSALVELAFKHEHLNGGIFLQGVLSRKKQVVPVIYQMLRQENMI